MPARTVVLLLAAIVGGPAIPCAAQVPPPIDVEQIAVGVDHLLVTHSPIPPGVRASIFRMDRAEGTWRRPGAGTIRHDTVSRSYRDSDVAPGHDYCYRIVSRAEQGTSGNQQGQMACAVFHAGDTSVRPPDPVVDPRVTSVHTTILELAFEDGADNEDSVVVERRSASGTWSAGNVAWTAVGVLPRTPGTGSTLRFRDAGLEMEVRYCYRLRSLNVHGSALALGPCQRTHPLGVGLPDPMTIGGPGLVALTHPADSVLAVRWLDDPTSADEWTVYLYAGEDLETPVRDARIRDRRTPVQEAQSYRFERLDPGALFCVAVARGTSPPRSRERLCESPYGPRTRPEEIGPTETDVPRLRRIGPTVENGQLALRLNRGARGQVVDVVRGRSGERFSRIARAGADSVILGRLAAGETYCVRMQLSNRYATRFGDQLCAETRAEAPARPTNVRVERTVGNRIELAWDYAPRASRYTLRFEGERRFYTDHDGSRSDVEGERYGFEAKSDYTYCFTVEGENGFGRSAPSSRLCDVRGNGGASVISYLATLEPSVPDQGVVIFQHTVAPGPPHTARLSEVQVIGNATTPYQVRFLKPVAGTLTCSSDPTLGVTVDPGSSLDAPGLRTLYGNTAPPIGASGLALIACKIPRTPAANSDPIPVVVRYRR